MKNRWDVGLKQDYDNMTKDIARDTPVLIFLRDDLLTSEGQRSEEEIAEKGIEETVFLQELDSTNEMVASGLLEVGDVRFEFLSDSIIENEALVTPDYGETFYKVMKMTKVKNQSNDYVIFIKAFGKKIPNR